MKLIAYVNYFLRNVHESSYTYRKVRPEVLRLLEQSEKEAREQGYAGTDYDLARFAVCAWIDESILSSGWAEKDKWQQEPLQMVYYNVTHAGESFFEQLNTIGPHQRDVREIYYLCLTMGFSGQYVNQGDEYMLGQLKMSNLKSLTGAQTVPDLAHSHVFPEAYVSEIPTDPKKGRPRNRFTWVTLASICAPLVLYITLFIVFQFVLSNIGDNLIQNVPK